MYYILYVVCVFCVLHIVLLFCCNNKNNNNNKSDDDDDGNNNYNNTVDLFRVKSGTRSSCSRRLTKQVKSQ